MDKVDSVDEEKKAGVSDPSRKVTKEGDSPISVVEPKKNDKPKKDKDDSVDEEKKAGVSDISG
jgi:hypothetical protein